MSKFRSYSKDFLLLLNNLTYLPVPKVVKADHSRLGCAMRFLTLLGAVEGGVLYAAMRLLQVMPFASAAAVLLGIDMLAGGAYLLRDLMAVAGGTSSQPESDLLDLDLPPGAYADNDTEIREQLRRFHVSRTGLVWGLIWLSADYLIYCFLLGCTATQQLGVLAAPVISRLLMSWLIYHYPALAPADWHRGLTKRGFVLNIFIAGLVLLPISSFPLLAGLLVAILGVYLFATYRLRFIGALDHASYGAMAAWAQLLFLLSFIAYIRFI